MQEMQVQPLGQEDPLEKEMATHSNILAWEIPWTEEEPGSYSPWGCKRVGHILATITTALFCMSSLFYQFLNENSWKCIALSFLVN